MATYKVIYTQGNISSTVTGDYSVNDITTMMRGRFPELATVNPTTSEEDGVAVLTFAIQAGNKAASYNVIYVHGNINSSVVGDYTVNDINDMMRGRFPELSSVNPRVTTVDNQTVLTYEVQAGNKAA